MTIEEMKNRKKELGYTNRKIADLSGVPLSTVQKIFGDWKVSAEDKNRIPLIQDVSQKGQPIIAILGSEFGYSDWIVK